MNLFQKYGIKEVADVVFYSITPVGDEEIYTPVLFLDTLKVSTLEKSAEKVSAEGGKGNKKLITWNFGKEVTLSLEDALFSPASMSMIWGGELQARLSPYTSAITKLMMANKYGKLHYSTKAYPSPALTDEEWDIVFQALERLSKKDGGGINIEEQIFPQIARDINGNNRYIVYYISDYEGDGFGINSYQGAFFTTSYVWNPVEEKYNYQDYISMYYSAFKREEREDFNFGWGYTIEKPIDTIEKGNDITVYNYYGREIGQISYQGPRNAKFSTFKNNVDSYNGQIDLQAITHVPGRYWITNYTGDSPLIEYFRDLVRKNYFKRTNSTEDNKAISGEVINEIIRMIDNLKKIGYIDTQIYDTEVVDRMEKCIVRNRDGLKISTAEQKKNLLRYYQDDKTTSYIIYYDAKTMLPLLSVGEDGVIKGWDAADNPNFYRDRDFDRQTDVDEFVIKPGTVYYKWSRTVKYKEGNDDGILGRTFVIDADTFPEAYKIVGETYIRDQKTGKDQRYQFTIHRAQVSSDTSITLEAEGDPTTFSMEVDVLTPPNDIMIELKQYDVDEDNIHGGTRIVPQKSRYTYTPTTIEIKERAGIVNDEMY